MIENRISGERFETVVAEITKKDVPRLDKKRWLFDWKKEHKQPDRVVYKLTTVENPDVIQGLISLRDSGDHILCIWLNQRRSIGVEVSYTLVLVGTCSPLRVNNSSRKDMMAIFRSSRKRS